jgi:uncharacterized membrane protein YjfL (UPF0719 family)
MNDSASTSHESNGVPVRPLRSLLSFAAAVTLSNLFYVAFLSCPLSFSQDTFQGDQWFVVLVASAAIWLGVAAELVLFTWATKHADFALLLNGSCLASIAWCLTLSACAFRSGDSVPAPSSAWDLLQWAALGAIMLIIVLDFSMMRRLWKKVIKDGTFDLDKGVMRLRAVGGRSAAPLPWLRWQIPLWLVVSVAAATALPLQGGALRDGLYRLAEIVSFAGAAFYLCLAWIAGFGPLVRVLRWEGRKENKKKMLRIEWGEGAPVSGSDSAEAR